MTPPTTPAAPPTTPSIGLCFHRETSAGQVVAQARGAEAAGFDEFWVIEDCFYTAGVSLAAAALTATERIGVGIGIIPPLGCGKRIVLQGTKTEDTNKSPAVPRLREVTRLYPETREARDAVALLRRHGTGEGR